MPVGNCCICGGHVEGRWGVGLRCASCVKAERRRKQEERLKSLEDRVSEIELKATKTQGSLITALVFARSGHNLLTHIAKGRCECDYEVGAAPCMTCAAMEILRKIQAALRIAGELGDAEFNAEFQKAPC